MEEKNNELEQPVGGEDLEQQDVAEQPNDAAAQTYRDKMLARLKSKHPDGDWADDEAIYSQAYDDYDEYEKNAADSSDELNGYKERENKLNEIFSADPQSAQFIIDMIDGKDPWVALISRVGIDGVQAIIEDPEKLEAFAAANKEYVARQAEGKKLNEEYEENAKHTNEVLDEIISEGNYTPEQIDEAMLYLRDAFNNFIMGKFDREVIETALKAVTHDSDVETAGSEGELRGRNTAIEEKLRTGNGMQGGDGVPMLGGSNNKVGEMPGSGTSIFDIAKGAR